jgi:hypothetical protein
MKPSLTPKAERAADRTTLRLWRMRRRGQHLDAILNSDGRNWTLTFLRNDRPLLKLDFRSERLARGDAAGRRRELEVAGWTEHW